MKIERSPHQLHNYQLTVTNEVSKPKTDHEGVLVLLVPECVRANMVVPSNNSQCRSEP
jgi:hypothetical protein